MTDDATDNTTDEREAAPRGVESGAMRKRRTTLEDGRYLIYYTFGDGRAQREGDAGAGKKGEPAARPAAGEEESV